MMTYGRNHILVKNILLKFKDNNLCFKKLDFIVLHILNLCHKYFLSIFNTIKIILI